MRLGLLRQYSVLRSCANPTKQEKHIFKGQRPYSTNDNPLAVAAAAVPAVSPLQETSKFEDRPKFASPVDSIGRKNLQKHETLLDTFGRHHTYLRISLTERCNLRCKYCMPEEGIQLTEKPKLLTTDEIFHIASLFVQEGVRKIRLTGGEPTVRKDIVQIIEKIKQIPQLENVGITTNGIMLTRLLVPMHRAGLDAINISLDTLKAKKYEEITRRKGWERVIAGLDLAIQLGYKPKVNCVLMKNFNEDEICDFVEFTKDRNVDIRFIEYMPFAGNKWHTEKLVSFRDALNAIRKKWPQFHALSNGPNDTSKAYAVPGFKGQIGFITSMTEHFCGTCNRLRITADGNLKVCLFGNKEISLRDAIRSGCSEDDLVALISSAVKRKKKQHAENLSRQPKSINSLLFPLSPYFIGSQIAVSINQFRQLTTSAKVGNPQNLTHIDAEGKAKMVDVSEKVVTERTAIAQATVLVGREIFALIERNNIAKGDVLSIAQIAGIIGAKRTSDLIPLCHNIALTSVDVQAELMRRKNAVRLSAAVRCLGKTGVEMEALTAVCIAALTVYDMCKAVSHDIIIQDVMLMEKSGGKTKFKRSREEDEITLKYKHEPMDLKEPFYPLHH